MPSKPLTQKLIVVITGLLAQYVTFYFRLGLLSGILAFVTSCGAFLAVHFFDAKVDLDRGKGSHSLSGHHRTG